jgi:hypothetical protein
LVQRVVPAWKRPAKYRKYAEECRRFAGKADGEKHKVILEEMAEVWSRLAAQVEQKGA